MDIAYIATFPPRECGIATFTQNLTRFMAGRAEADAAPARIRVVAVNDHGREYSYPSEVGFVIRQDVRDDYVKAARWVNESGAQCCVLQHEFGIFGGRSGVYVLSFLAELQIPFIATLHTVLREPSFLQKSILRELARRAAGLVVMSRKAVGFLERIYGVDPAKIHLIEHGVPDQVPAAPPEGADLLSDCRGRRILFTFGLLNRNKGIETVIKALPEVVATHPEVLYIVLGNTHPAVLRHSGEEYREFLQQLVDSMGLSEHVRLVNGFITEEQLAYYLSCIDLYITPYLNEAQITSGTLSYAVGAGAAVLSTPYWHAEELLADNRGVLFGFKDHRQLAAAILRLLDHPQEADQLRQQARAYGQRHLWSRTATRYLKLLNSVVEEDLVSALERRAQPQQRREPSPALPPFNATHIRRLTDSTGILQHAKFGIPNLKEGYCLDDNARAMIWALMALRQQQGQDLLSMLSTYLAFIHYMQRPDGLFHNFLDYRRHYLDDVGSEDAYGRTMWALGYLIRYAPNSALREFGLELFHRALPHADALQHLRGLADTIIGVSHYLAFFPSDEGIVSVLRRLTRPLTAAYDRHATEDWRWFEPSMCYDNGILPLALLHSSEVTGDTHARRLGFEALQFLEQTCFPGEHYVPVGNRGWYPQGGSPALFDQQALETMAMVLLYAQAYRLTGKVHFLHRLRRCHGWFLGQNELHIPLYDQDTGGCCDGLEEDGINRNQGAESTLAYWISHLVMTRHIVQGTAPLRQQRSSRPPIKV